jgi:hypothetical protein
MTILLDSIHNVNDEEAQAGTLRQLGVDLEKWRV